MWKRITLDQARELWPQKEDDQMDDRIAILAGEGETGVPCSVCGGGPISLVVRGRESCGECGNEIDLCDKCACRMLMEIEDQIAEIKLARPGAPK
jgi:hypothetical protein